MEKSKFYEYRQNNSGGSFVNSENEGICEYVIIEASSADEANKIAENIGIYFDGVDKGEDCECCGDRWYEASEGSDVPSIYGEPIENMQKDFYRNNCFIHYLDGRVEKIEFQD